MASRHQSRILVLQSLYEIDFRGLNPNEFENILNHNIKEFSHDEPDLEYTKNLLDGILKKKDEIDQVIIKAAPEWPLDKIASVDRNVLRLGLYELIYADKKEVPAKVAINEAIEVAKFFSGETSGKFINGVLGAVYRDIYGEDDKNAKHDAPARKVKKELTEEEKAALPVQKLIGSIVYGIEGNDIYLALVHDVFGFWTIAKGKFLENEEPADASHRKVLEELGIESAYVQDIDSSEYIASHPEFKKIKKQVQYVLAKAKFEPLLAKKEGGLKDAAWFKADAISDLTMYDDMKPILAKSLAAIAELKEDK
jgi:N utilization substance protein B